MYKSPSKNLVAIALGVLILIETVFSWLGFRVFGPTTLWTGRAFIITVGTLLNMILIWLIHREFPPALSWFSQLVFFIGTLGSLLALIGSSFDLLNAMVGHSLIIWFPLSQTPSIIVFGYGIVGIWLVLLNFDARVQAAWPARVAWLGMISGVIMAIGLFALPRIFIPYVSLSHQLVPELAELVGTLGWMIVYPIWSIWFGSVATKDPSRGQQLQGLV